MPLSLFDRLDTLLAPPPPRKRVRSVARAPYAHRGLHGSGRVENSRAAFSAAIALGHGIELDVQVAAGGEAFVFHDATLDRLTDENGLLCEREAKAIDRIKLKGTDETIPRLPEILALVAGRVPVLIEVKHGQGRLHDLCASVRRAMEGYRGPCAVMSFHPNVPAWFRKHSPRTVRGLVITEEGETSALRRIKGRLLRQLMLWRAKPDFLAYDVRDLPAAFPAAQRRRGMKVLTWTVRTAAQERIGLDHADELIYERPA